MEPGRTPSTGSWIRFLVIAIVALFLVDVRGSTYYGYSGSGGGGGGSNNSSPNATNCTSNKDCASYGKRGCGNNTYLCDVDPESPTTNQCYCSYIVPGSAQSCSSSDYDCVGFGQLNCGCNNYACDLDNSSSTYQSCFCAFQYGVCPPIGGSASSPGGGTGGEGTR